MFKTYATGDYTLSELTEELAERGVKSRQTPKRAPKPYSRAQVHRLLTNPSPGPQGRLTKRPANRGNLNQLANDEARRALNQALFDKLFVVDDGITGADLAEPYTQLLDTDLETNLDLRVSAGCDGGE